MTTQPVETWALALIEEIRDEIRALDFEPLDDQALAEMHAAIEDAVIDNASEGIYRTPDLAAFHRMLIEERAPGHVRDIAVDRFMRAIADRALSAAAHPVS